MVGAVLTRGGSPFYRDELNNASGGNVFKTPVNQLNMSF